MGQRITIDVSATDRQALTTQASCTIRIISLSLARLFNSDVVNSIVGLVACGDLASDLRPALPR
jgi:hypothetical protein